MLNATVPFRKYYKCNGVSIFLHVILLASIFLSINASALETEVCDPQSRLINDLLTVDYWNRRLSERFPVTYNHLLQGGYFSMPSARMGPDGEIGIGYAHVPPYRNYNVRCQIHQNLEITGNYRVFRGIKDPVLSPFGFGDYSDKGINFKLALFRPEDSGYQLPGLALGFEDFIGTKAFYAKYAVITQVFMKQNLEISLGYGTNRIKGFFGGVAWIPFRKSSCKWLKPLSLEAEYDAIPYKDVSLEKHPKGRKKSSPINYGIKYRLLDHFDFSLSYIRGEELAFSASTFYNFGYTEGFLPKIDDPLPYREPVNIQSIGYCRTEDSLVQEFVKAFKEQGLELLDIFITEHAEECKTLRLHVLNETFRLESQLRERLNYLLAYLTPENIEEVRVVIYSEGFPIQEYQFRMEFVRRFAAQEIGSYELKLLTPLREVTRPNFCTSTKLFSERRNLFNFELAPRIYTFFGSASGKFKYTLGLATAFNGFLPYNIYYNIILGYTLLENVRSCSDYDRLNPSQLINVRTDIIRYFHTHGLTLDEGYLQKSWTLGRGWFARLGAGYFDIGYGGGAAELLYYPINGCWAVGVEGAVLKKRTYSGIGFTNKIRKLEGFSSTYHRFTGSQYFLNLYYDWEYAHLDFKISAGKFLANDWGARYEISRYFPSGLRLTVWYTRTNGRDKVNGQTYYDKGIAFTMPFDIFYTHSERTLWNYGISAWLRDVGVQAYTGLQLYELINDQRQ